MEVPFSPTSAQRRLLWRYRADPTDDANHIFASFEMPTLLDSLRLREAVDAVCQKHDALRTRFALKNGIWIAWLSGRSCVQVVEVDLTRYSFEGGRVEADNLFKTALSKAVNFSSGLLMTVFLFKFFDGSSRISVAVDHLAFDGYSRAPFLRDLVLAYSNPNIISAAGVATYSSYAHDQEKRLLGKEDLLSPVRMRMAGGVRIIDWPGQSRRDAVGPRMSGYLRRTLNASMHTEICKLAAAMGMSVFGVSMAALSSAVSTVAEVRAPVIIVPSHGRAGVQYQNSVGCFVSHQPTAIDWEYIDTYREGLLAGKNVVASAISTIDVPGELALLPLTGPSLQPLASVQLNFRNGPEFQSSLNVFGATAVPIPLITKTEVDLAILLETGEAGQLDIFAKFDLDSCSGDVACSVLDSMIDWISNSTFDVDRMVSC